MSSTVNTQLHFLGHVYNGNCRVRCWHAIVFCFAGASREDATHVTRSNPTKETALRSAVEIRPQQGNLPVSHHGGSCNTEEMPHGCDYDYWT